MDRLAQIIIVLVSAAVVAIAAVSFTQHQAETIKIGAVLPLTGPQALLGESELRGIQLAVDEINAAGGAGGKQIELLVEDDEFEPNKAFAAANKLINVDDVDVLIVSFSPPASAVLPLANEKKKLLLIPASLTRGLAKRSKYAFKDYTDITIDTEAIADVLKREGIDKAALLYILTDAGVELSEAFHSAFTGNITVEETIEPNEPDMRTQLLKIKNSGAEALVFLGLPNDNVPLLQQTAEMNITIPLFLNLAAFPPVTAQAELLEQLNPVTTWYSYYNELETNPRTQDFRARFAERFNREPDADAAFLYDDIYVIANAIEKCGSADADCLSEELINIKSYEGVAGTLGFDEDGNSIRAAYLIRYVNGSWQPLGAQSYLSLVI